MLTHRRIIKCIQPQDRFAAIDLRDAFNSSATHTVPTVCIQYRVLPFRLSLSPCVFTKVVEGQGPQLPLRLAHPGPIPRSVVRSQGLGASAPQPVGASGQLGKEQALPCAENLFSRFGVRLGEYDERAQAVLNCLSFFRGRNVVPLKLLGPMASTAAVTQLGLLHMKPLQHWLHSRVPRWAWRRVTLQVNITQECRRSFSPGRILPFYGPGCP